VNLARSIEHHPLNIAIFRLVNHARHPLLDWITVGMTTIQLGWMLPVVFALTWRFRQAKLAPLAVALLLETALVIIVKKAFPQPRPAFLLDDVYLVRPYFTNAFPSGDVALMAVLAAILAPGERLPLRVLLWGGVALIAWQRMYIGVHFPLDCLGGIGIGIMAAVVARRWRQRRRSHTREPAAPTPALDA
ncbi:MAG TPA: phosphatase PAP2 family protein, partial [Armatimonadota bacterium]|nr:phosphatase PAP2 family protein [Armatimonadota bacterium]